MRSRLFVVICLFACHLLLTPTITAQDQKQLIKKKSGNLTFLLRLKEKVKYQQFAVEGGTVRVTLQQKGSCVVSVQTKTARRVIAIVLSGKKIIHNRVNNTVKNNGNKKGLYQYNLTINNILPSQEVYLVVLPLDPV